MKYFIIPYVALGSVLSLVFGIEYSCDGPEMFPTFYGSPFVFKRTSLGSSMEFFFSVSGLTLNILIWSIILYFLDKWVKKIIKARKFRIGYKVVVGILIVFSTLCLAINLGMAGSGFEKKSNYWYWNMDQEAKNWGMNCDGQLIMFKK